MKDIIAYISLSERNWEIQENEYVKHRDVDSLRQIAEQVLESKSIEGSVVDFHNFAVDLAGLNQHKLACEILDRGISIYSNSVDLLADYLVYAKDFEGYREKCEIYYNTLRGIPDKLWTWRGYAFSLEYLNSKLLRTNDPKKIKSDICLLVQAYHDKFSNELPYLAEANLYRGVEPEEEWRVIKKAVSQLENHPRCSIRYVELLLGKSAKTEEYIKAAEDLELPKLQISKDLDFGYAQFLRGLCLMRLLTKDDYGKKEKIEEIYQCFRIAQLDDLRVRGSDLNIIRKQISMLKVLSKIEYKDDA